MDRSDKYFRYLVDKVDGLGAYSGRTTLLKQLFETEYRWDYKIPLDSDRAEDGKNLRLSYFHETGKHSHMEFKPCTVLEMLIAMSLAMENIMGAPGDYHPERWFWEMLENIGIANMKDRNYDSQSVASAIDVWLSRDYDKKGHGGIFPLHRSKRDVRRMPIWEQAGMYMTERC